MMSPALRSWKSDRPMPHSKPACTSRASSLKRFSEVIVPVQMIDAVAQEPHLRAAGDRAVAHVAARDGADTRDAEDLAHLGLAGDDLFELGLEHAHHGVLDVLEHLVDDLVGAHLDVFGLGERPRLAVGPHVEADDGGARRGRELDVVLGDAADAAMHERRASPRRARASSGSR